MSDYNKNIFINCPFDNDYYKLLRPLLFTILYQGYNPRISLESSDSGQARLEKIHTLIQESKYSIHDLSRLQSKKRKEYYRLNMPFELGIDFGCRKFDPENHADKCFLIIEKEQFRYMKALSDINGFDLKSHKNKPQELIRAIRDWFVETVNISAKSSTVIWYKFIDFNTYLYENKTREGFSKKDIDYMPIPELITNMKDWITNN